MAKLLATLRFYLDSEVDEGNSSAERKVNDKGDYEIILRPQNDKTLTQTLGLKTTPKVLQSIIAHELGHFIAEVTHDPTHNPLARFLLGPVDGESKAWELAKQIVDIDPEVQKAALKTYVQETDSDGL